MGIKKEDMLLYAVTDRTWLNGKKLKDQVEEVLKAGATLIQLREKDMPFDEFVAEAKEIYEITKRYGVPLIINDNVEVAIAVDADGVHLGQDDEDVRAARKRFGSNKIIGLSAHTVAEAVAAQNSGADYIGVGAVFSTTTKKDANTIRLNTLKEICHAVTIPVVAIGGITKLNIQELYGTGVDGIAVISAIFAQTDVEAATKEIREFAQQWLK